MAAETFGLCGEDEDKGCKRSKVDKLRRPAHPKDGFCWRISYQERAFLTKIKVPTRHVRPTSTPMFYDPAVPLEVKFITNHPDRPTADGRVDVTTYRLKDDFMQQSESIFEANVQKACGDAFDFKLSVDGKEWDNAFSIIKQKELSFSESSESWISPKPALLPSQDSKNVYYLVQSLEHALLTDMGNGDAKRFIGHLLTSIANHSNIEGTIEEHESPVLHSTTNGQMQYVDPKDDSTWCDHSQDLEELKGFGRFNASSSLSNLAADDLICESSIHRKVPDHIWYLHQYPGYFILNVACKKVRDYSARIQCVHQMLTQMHFQNSAFGLVFAKINWLLIFIYKDGNKLSVNQISRPLMDDNGNFDVENFKFLCSWLYKILDYRLKCLAG